MAPLGGLASLRKQFTKKKDSVGTITSTHHIPLPLTKLYTNCLFSKEKKIDQEILMHAETINI